MQELHDEVIETFEKVLNGYNLETEKKVSLVDAYLLLRNFGNYHDLSEYAGICDNIAKEVNYAAFDKVASFYEQIGPKLKEKITLPLYEKDYTYKDINDRSDIKKEILDFYKDFDKENYPYLKQLLNNNNHILLGYNNSPLRDYRNTSGQAILHNYEPYVVVKGDGKTDGNPIYISSALVHEIGHVITYRFKDYNKMTGSPLAEVIPRVAELSFISTHSNKEEKAKNYFSLLRVYNNELKYADNKKFSEIQHYIAHRYITAASIGLYLSKLYAEDNKKFKELYDYIKKYEATPNENDIFDVFLNDKDYMNMDYIEEEIEKNKKILLK